MSEPIALALIGGTGLYALPDLEVIERRVLDTPWGAPSAPLVLGRFHGHALAFLARHGEQHQLAPHRVNYRANLWALHALGARRVLAVNAVGGIRADLAPRALALPDQLIDYTWGRAGSYSDADGAAVTHIDFGEPYGANLRRDVRQAARRAGVALIDGGCYGATQGPRLETIAEIARLRRDGCDLVGMTGMPEAALARELELDYACLAVVANWAAGCDPEPHAITMDEVQANVAAAGAGIPALLAALLAMA
ncbi:MAG: S-methyl-5'-thioinosine phosphorylase [Xanthomonadaceae bacterium]|nr:S-methyl-5'-thioinosine phosphorylase [Xanthomonadaceae bacterium]MDE1957883.1 S-methyl-5'-thioinosine phosphorylase [Xanthomonadaceae bacterium]MDE2177060.1 S-methyl-5'-thioinosine phosphorylase [Xanthomonadaceae bacterium]MDE2246781.1 S-methyl-5'-thioinosine phosphorylase [Xanthomonadaceae bacterium]